MARLALFLALACLGCVSHRPADRRVTSDELAALWMRGQALSMVTVVWYRGSTAAGDFFLVSEPGLSNPRERRYWIPASESVVRSRFPLTDDRSQWRREFQVGNVEILRAFELPPVTNDLLKQPLFTNRVGLIQP
jgi:hypothetical protein